ncbi:MAG: hypothetical protein Q9201_000302 [Fulgogasparrea decipioides]
MQGLSRPAKDESKLDAADTLGLEGLKIGNVISGGETSQMRRKISRRQASPGWPQDRRAPGYERLNIPPLGSIHHAGYQLTQGSVPVPPETPSPSTIFDPPRPMATTANRTNSTLYPRSRTQKPQANQSRFNFQAQESSSSSGPTPHRQGRWTGTPRESQPKPRRVARSVVKPPPIPHPNKSYIARSGNPSTKLLSPQPLLLALDLNGTLLYRPKASSAYRPRPSLNAFLAHCISNYSILVWSSATPPNVTAICSQIFTPEQRKLIVGEWGRDTLGLIAKQYQAKVQVYKDLDRVWSSGDVQRAHPDFASGGRWSQDNTLLLDDSVLKASAQPYNAVVVPEYVKDGSEEKDGREVLGQVVAYLETARKVESVSSFVREHPFKVNACWKWDWVLGQPAEVEVCSDSEGDDGGVQL